MHVLLYTTGCLPATVLRTQTPRSRTLSRERNYFHDTVALKLGQLSETLGWRGEGGDGNVEVGGKGADKAVEKSKEKFRFLILRHSFPR